MQGREPNGDKSFQDGQGLALAVRRTSAVTGPILGVHAKASEAVDVNVLAAPRKAPRRPPWQGSVLPSQRRTEPVWRDRTTLRFLQKQPANPIGIFATAEWEGSTVQIKRDFRLLLAGLGDSSVEFNPNRVLHAGAPTHQRFHSSMRHCHG